MLFIYFAKKGTYTHAILVTTHAFFDKLPYVWMEKSMKLNIYACVQKLTTSIYTSMKSCQRSNFASTHEFYIEILQVI